MRRLYTAGLALYLLARLPGFIVSGLRGKHDLGRRLREGFRGPRLLPSRDKSVWVHACSLGEVLAAGGLIAGLRERLPGQAIYLSTVTRTGYEIARGRLADAVEGVFYFPFDLPAPVRRSLDAIHPGVVVIVETEIWPNFLAECYRRGVEVVWVNGRISDKAFWRYRLASRFLSPLLARARLFVMRTAEDARRIRQMGAAAERVVVAGNLKYDRGTLERSALAEAARRLDELLGLSNGGPLIVAGSTTEPEETIALNALRIVRQRPGLESARLLIAPRHPERFAQVAAAVEAHGLRLTRRSQPTREPTDVILLDSIGELAGAYAFAGAVLVGGSFARRGGQSILEPAIHNRAAVVGPHMENFREVLGDFKSAGAVIQIEEEEPGAAASLLAEAWGGLLERPQEAAEMGRRARAVLERNEGATERALAQLVPIVEASCGPPKPA